jgi:hypothetical protein
MLNQALLSARAVFTIVSCGLLAYGVWGLESGSIAIAKAYILTALGAAGIVFSPKASSERGPSALWSSRTTPILLGIVSAFCAYKLYAPTLDVLSAIEPRTATVPKMLIFWAGAFLAFVGCCVSLDLRRRISWIKINRDELLIICGIFSLSLLARIWGPNSWVVDEISQVLEISKSTPLSTGPLGSTSTTYPYFVLYCLYWLHYATRDFIELLPLLKAVSFISSSLSVVFLYGSVRVLCGRRIALYSALLLSCWGWHWINSRFVYAYPLDMANITFGLLMFVLATRRFSFTYAAFAGLSCGLALITQKVGVMLLPLLGYIGLELLILTARADRFKLILTFCFVAIGLVLTYEPELIALKANGGQFSRQKEAATLRANELPKMGLNEYSATALITLDGLRQLQTEIFDRSRHVFRPDRPILDPIFSALFSVGVIYSLFRIVSFQAGRFALVGMIVFILPMALSFPVESANQGLARRMICASFFIAWLAGIGADLLSSRLVSHARAVSLATSLCVLSIGINIYYAFTTYSHPEPKQFFELGDRGLSSTAMMKLAREAGAQKIPTVVFEQYNADTQGAASNFPEVVRAFSLEELRNTITSRRGELQLVIVPWDTKIWPRESQKLVQDLSDLIPQYLWIPGERDPQGIPMLRYAFVRVG